MKIKGKKIEGPNRVIIPIPRDTGDIIFIATAVLDFTVFNKMIPEPVPPNVQRPNKQSGPDLFNKDYLEQVNKRNNLRFNWIILESLKATPELEWETVKLEDSNTWENWTTELKNSGFAEIEIGRISRGCMEANCLNEDKVEAARSAFLQAEQQEVIAK